MLNYKITYENPITNAEVTEEHYFNISKADMVRMEVEDHKVHHIRKEDGVELTGWMAKLQKIVDSEDGKGVMAEIEDMITRSFGHREGDRFLRSPEYLTDFRGSGAYDQLFFDLCTDAAAAAEFVTGIFPKNLDKVAVEVAERAEAWRAAEAAKTSKTESPAIAAVEKVAEATGADVPKDPTGLTNPTVAQELTQAQVVEMDAAELQAGLASGKYVIGPPSGHTNL